MPNEQLVLDRVFQALSSPTRRDVLDRLGRGPATMTELAEPVDMALPSFLQHLQVLERSGLVSSQKKGRVRVFKVEPQTLEAADNWLDSVKRHWNTRLDQLDTYLESKKETTS